ncbi:MAG: winged helix-turn-helix transcriptional regulator [Acidobacteria bacterium]|nr:winged helix-turn-helix transcriptional regulator [Acidobacteriota bacterium]
MKHSPLTRLVQTHKALAHPARLRILAMLRGGELCVCQITAVLGLAPSTVSAHLKELRNAGLTAERKQGKWIYVGLSDDDELRETLGRVVAELAGDPLVVDDTRMVAELQRIPVETLCRDRADMATKERTTS